MARAPAALVMQTCDSSLPSLHHTLAIMLTGFARPTRGAEQVPKPDGPDRVALISAVKTYLGFFVLVVLVVEAALGALAVRTQGQNQLVAMYGMLFVILTLVAIVAFFAYKKPQALLRSVAADVPSESGALQDFCRSITGQWWQRIIPDESSAIAFLEIRLNPTTNTIRMSGRAYSKSGEPAAFWESVASCINLSERKIFYYWKGWYSSRPNEPYEGFGEISFPDSSKQVDSGAGYFSDTNVTDMKSTTRKSFEIRRSAGPEIQVMLADDREPIAALIRKKLS